MEWILDTAIITLKVLKRELNYKYLSPNPNVSFRDNLIRQPNFWINVGTGLYMYIHQLEILVEIICSLILRLMEWILDTKLLQSCTCH